MRLHWVVAALLAVGSGLSSPRDAAGTPPFPLAPRVERGARHDIHLTYTRMVVDGASVVARVRLFKDDAERALRGHAKRPELRLESGATADPVFADYFNAHVAISADGERLRARVLQSGPDPDAGEFPMWWYLVELPAKRPVKSLVMRVGLLFEHFTDQRNVVTVLEMPGEKRHSLYFAGDSKDQLITMGGR